MLVLSAIESSKSAWSSPIVLTDKIGDPVCFCNDFSKVNEVSEFDAYPMAHVNEQWVHFIATLDLNEAYWQDLRTRLPLCLSDVLGITSLRLFVYVVTPPPSITW